MTLTPIAYYGGKTSIMHEILPLIPSHDCYTETFFGGGAVFFSKDPVKNETINDKLDIVVNFYRTLKLHFNLLKPQIEASLIGRTIHNEALNYIRLYRSEYKADSTQLSLEGRVKLAWAFWICTNFAFSNKIGGGYKYSNHMSTSVPKTLKNRKENFTEHLVARIENAYIENEDAIKVLESRNSPSAFHYLDPPYPNADQGHYAGYGWDQYENLLNQCVNTKGKFILSSYNSEMLDRYITEMKWSKKEVVHRISGKKNFNSRKGREDRGMDFKTEVIVCNFDITHKSLKLFAHE